MGRGEQRLPSSSTLRKGEDRTALALYATHFSVTEVLGRERRTNITLLFLDF